MTTAANSGSIATTIVSYIETSLSGTTIIKEMVEDNVVFVQNVTGDSNGLIARNVPALIHLTIADTIAYEVSFGVDADWQMGDVRIKKGEAAVQQQAAIKYHGDKAKKLLEPWIRYPMRWNRVYTV